MIVVRLKFCIQKLILQLVSVKRLPCKTSSILHRSSIYVKYSQKGDFMMKVLEML